MNTHEESGGIPPKPAQPQLNPAPSRTRFRPYPGVPTNQGQFNYPGLSGYQSPSPGHGAVSKHQPQSQPPQLGRSSSATDSRDSITATITWLGAGILLLGVVFLAFQAIDRDWLGPSAAVILVAVLCLGLFIYSLVTHHQSPTGPVAPALLTASALGFLCDTWAITFGLEWIEGWLAAGIMTAISIIGLSVARVWNHLWLTFTTITCGGLFLAFATLWPSMSKSDTTVSIDCLFALGIAGWASVWRRDWVPVEISAAFIFLMGAAWSAGTGQILQLSVATFCAIATVTVLGLTPTASNASAATTAATLVRWLPVSLMTITFLLINQISSNSYSGLVIRGTALAIALITCSIPTAWCLVSGKSLATASKSSHLPPPTSSAQWTQRGYQLPLPPVPATIADNMRAAFGTGLVALAVVLTEFHLHSNRAWWLCAMIAVSSVLVWFSSRFPLAFVAAFGGYVLLLGIPLLLPAIDQNVDAQHQPAWLSAGLYVALGAAVFYRASTMGLTRDGTIATEGALLLVGTASIPLLSRELSDSEHSFMIGHLAVSVLWMLLGVFFLLRRDARVGLTLAVATTGKLVFYDLGTLDGLIKVAAFILCGLILLICAMLRERDQRHLTTVPTTSSTAHTVDSPAMKESAD